jgi:hypothetical protein
MHKILFETFAQAMSAMNLLKSNNIPASYWPEGGDTPRASKPIIHQVAIDSRYKTMAESILEAHA